ncbi:CRISPR-associated endonuclease Cas1 [candidate division NPL-UPA2 bacterium]|nr:CRISPR-associated endonuclease Cas1 [candidate division NPL-UPA2 bacterium]
MQVIYPGIYEFSNICSAFKRVKRKKGIAGVDGVSMDFFSLALGENLHKIKKELEKDIYCPQPFLRLHIDKGNGNVRSLSIPTVRDRIVQQALLNILTPIIDPEFKASSFAYRRGKSVDGAISKMKGYIDEGYRWILRSDVESFFDSIEHNILMEKLREIITEDRALNLIDGWLKAEVYDGLNIISPKKGIPQGASISPLLANVYLNEFDEMVGKRDCQSIRYGDDFAILCKDRSSAEDTLNFIQDFLITLHLSLNFDKTRISEFEDGFKFLGRVFSKHHTLNPLRTSEPGKKSLPEAPPPKPSSCSKLMRSLYIQEQGSILRKDHGRIVIVKGKETLLKVPATKIDQIIILGNCHITTPLMRYCLKKRISITLLSNYGGYYGQIKAPDSINIDLQRQQLLKFLNPDFSLVTSRAIIKGKIANARVLLQRHNRKLHLEEINRAVKSLNELSGKVEEVKSPGQLRGIEGIASANYFKVFRLLLKNDMGFTKRIKHPPTDPVNSLLSFGYTLLFYNIYSFLNIYGLSPYFGCFHTNKGSHPVLASDMIEEFRAPVVDSLVIYLINSSILKESDFYYQKEGEMCLLRNEARKVFIKHFEDRMHTRITHPNTELLANWRQCIELQIKEMVGYLQGRINQYRPILVRY